MKGLGRSGAQGVQPLCSPSASFQLTSSEEKEAYCPFSGALMMRMLPETNSVLPDSGGWRTTAHRSPMTLTSKERAPGHSGVLGNKKKSSIHLEGGLSDYSL